MKENCGTRGIITGFTQGFRKEEMWNNSWEKEKKNWCGWAPKTVEHKIEFTKKVMERDGHGVDENLTTKQKKINSPQVM